MGKFAIRRLSVAILAALSSPGWAQRAAPAIDWQSARQAQVEAEKSGKGERVRAGLPATAQLNQTRLPVLLIDAEATRSSPSFAQQGTSYVAHYALNGASLSVTGLSSPLIVDKGPLVAMKPAGARSGPYLFEIAEDVSDLSFVRFGASYTMRISCDKDEDKRCTDAAYLTSIANKLVPAGGAAK